MPPKKCPSCNSTKIKSNTIKGKTTFKCYRCGFVNEVHEMHEVNEVHEVTK